MNLKDINNFSYIEICPKCNKKFRVYEEEQIPGFRDMEYMICPYCKKTIRQSMEYEYVTEKIGE